MDKEKQGFEKSSFKRLLDLGNKENQKTLADYYIVSEGRINNFVDCLENGRAEIAALKAEIERKDEDIVRLKNWIAYISENAHYKHAYLDDHLLECIEQVDVWVKSLQTKEE
jgi:hypothetical protein